MQNSPNEREIARPDSWETVKMPIEVSHLPFQKTYTAEEFSVIARGLVPEVMEDKWFIYMQNNELYFHRSWTGDCIYKVILEENNAEYIVKEALVNNQYTEQDNADYDIALLNWLIDALLLDKSVPFPIPKGLATDATPGLFQHVISGTGFPELQIEENEDK